MTEDTSALWAIIDEARAVSPVPDRMAEVVEARLARLDKSSIQRFDRGFWTMMHRAYTWDLWGVANLVNGHNGQEGFVGFRSWIVSRGQQVFTDALEDADSLATQIAEARALAPGAPLFADSLCQAARSAYESAHGTELPTPTLDLFAAPIGEPVVVSELTTRFPRVAAVV